jgi:hypothetical protein
LFRYQVINQKDDIGINKSKTYDNSGQTTSKNNNNNNTKYIDKEQLINRLLQNKFTYKSTNSNINHTQKSNSAIINKIGNNLSMSDSSKSYFKSKI